MQYQLLDYEYKTSLRGKYNYRYYTWGKCSRIPALGTRTPIILYGLKTTNPLVFQWFNDVQDKYFDHQFIYTDDSKDDHKVGCAVFWSLSIINRRLPDQASIYTAESHAIQLALDVVYKSNKNKYVICVDSLSCLQAIEHKDIDHPLVLDVLIKYSALTNKHKTILFCWVPSHVGIRGNEQADEAAKAALNERPPTWHYHTPILNRYINIFIRGKWSDFWVNQINNKLHSVQPILGCGSLSNRNHRREQLVLCRLRLGHTYRTQVLRRTHQSRVRKIWQWNTSWSTMQSICTSDTNVLMLIHREKHFSRCYNNLYTTSWSHVFGLNVFI